VSTIIKQNHNNKIEKYTEVQDLVYMCVYVVVMLPDDGRHKGLKHVLEEK
jgi:hypothetical protein